MINSTVAWLRFFQRYTKFSVLDHPNPSAKSTPYGSIFYAFHLAGALVNRLVSGPCLFSNALLCPDLWATVYTAAAAVFVFLFFPYRQRETYGFHILAHRKIGEGEGRDA